MGKTKVVLSFRTAMLRPLSLLGAKFVLMFLLVMVSVCGVTTCYGNTAAFVPLASDNSLFKECCRQGEIGTTRIVWVNSS